MKRFACAIGLLALGIAAATPARADYAVVHRLLPDLVGRQRDTLRRQLDQGRHDARLGVGQFRPLCRDRRQDLSLTGL
jgi:hypothetical protein